MFPTLAQAAGKIELVEDLHLVLPEQPRPWLLIALITVGVLAVLGAGVWWWLRRRAKRNAPIPPETIAFADLETLHANLAQMNANEYALRISQILRIYIEGQYGLLAPKRSTEEFLAEAELSEKLPQRKRAAVGKFLKRCDVVKFALGDLAMEGKLSLHKEAHKFVEETAAEMAKLREAEALAAKAAARAAKAARKAKSKSNSPEGADSVAAPKAEFSSEYRPAVTAPSEPEDVYEDADLPTLNPREVPGR